MISLQNLIKILRYHQVDWVQKDLRILGSLIWCLNFRTMFLFMNLRSSSDTYEAEDIHYRDQKELRIFIWSLIWSLNFWNVFLFMDLRSSSELSEQKIILGLCQIYHNITPKPQKQYCVLVMLSISWHLIHHFPLIEWTLCASKLCRSKRVQATSLI